ncbi:MAG: MBL fold metallo-hydrolase [Nocardioides sp.]|nr:MBL fold metallo-hydrolase [Nocardioides sp.]
MKVTVIGCSGSYPGPESPASCYLLEVDEVMAPPADADGSVGDEPVVRTWRILLDLGNGSLGALHRYVDPLSIDAVLLSHLHPDHCMDLCGYYVQRKYHPTGPQPQIPVYGPRGTADRMAKAYGLDLDPGMHEEFDFREYDAPFTVGPFSVVPIRVNHPVAAYGLRISAGGSTIGYSGDTAPCSGLDKVAADVRLLLCEASFRELDDNPPDIHCTGADAGDVAARARARRLVLTHVPPWFEAEGMVAEARTRYSGPIELAAAGRSWVV